MGFANLEPLVSVIVPVYDNVRYTERAIDSILQQNYRCEIVVVDCSSSDRTTEILTTYGERVRSVRQQGGIAAVLNTGIAAAQGDLITFLAADEYYLPGKLASQAAIFIQRNDVGLVDSGWQKIEDNKPHNICPWESIPELELKSWLTRNILIPSTMMFRHEWLQYVGGFTEGFSGAETWDLVLKLALHGCRSAWSKQVTVCRRAYPTIDDSLLQAHSMSAVIDNFFTQPNLPQTIRARQNSVRYRTLVETAWYLNYRGHRAEAMTCLRRAWSYRTVLATETIVDWSESFIELSRFWQVEFDVNSLAVTEEWQQLLQWTMEITDKTASN